MPTFVRSPKPLLLLGEIARSLDPGTPFANSEYNEGTTVKERRQAQMTAAINEINRAITASLDLETILVTILECAQRIVPYYVAEICLWDAAQQTMFTRGSAGDPTFRAEMGGFYQLDEGYTGWIARHREPLLIPDTNVRQDVHPKLDLPENPIRSYLGVPFLVEDALVGTLEMISNEVGAYNEQDMATLQTFASQAAVAIENARLFEETQRLLEDISLLYQAGQAVTSSLEITHVLDSVAAAMTKAIGTSGSAISEWDREAGVLTTLANYTIMAEGSEVDRVRAVADYPATARLLETRQPLIVNLDDKAGNPAQRRLLTQVGYASMLAVPLVAKDRVVGLVELYDDASRDFTSSDIELSQALASQAAIALENARLYEAQHHRAEEMAGTS
jgi:GAF domain-containing protein